MAKAKDDSRRQYQTENLAREYIKESLSQHFTIIEEVKAIGPEGDKFKIDAVCQCKQTGWYIGLEIKRSHLFKSEFARAIRQAIHYRLSRIDDMRIPDLKSQHLPTVALFPDWMGEHDEDSVSYPLEAAGMRLIAAQMRVSTFRANDLGNLALHNGQSAIWTAKKGWNGNAEGWLMGKRPLGATRRKDSN